MDTPHPDDAQPRAEETEATTEAVQPDYYTEWPNKVEALATDTAEANGYDPIATLNKVIEAVRIADEARAELVSIAQAKSMGAVSLRNELNAAIANFYDEPTPVAASEADIELAPPRGMLLSDYNAILDEVVSGVTGGSKANLDDRDISNRFVTAHGDEFRYDGNHWYFWNDYRWEVDNLDRVSDKIGKFCSHLAFAERNRVSLHKQEFLASVATLSKTERLARINRTIRKPAIEWDADPWLLGVPTGIVDLRDGNFRPATRNDLASKSTAVDPLPWDSGLEANPFRDCPTFEKFIKWATCGDQSLLDYLQRVFGYALTAHFDEQALFFFHGDGENGKSVTIELFRDILGDYATVADRKVFTAARTGFERHSTELHHLRGSRMATVVEGQEDQQWDGALVKGLTGGDKTIARGIARDPVEFLPTFKLFFTSNHLPNIGNVGKAWRRRFHLIEFAAKLPGSPDKQLPKKMTSEWSAILRWAITGCLSWQKIGLTPPPSVVAASGQYLAAQDSIERWLTECFDRDPGFKVESTAVWQSYEAWRKANGEPSLTQKGLVGTLRQRGFKDGGKDATSRRALIEGLKKR